MWNLVYSAIGFTCPRRWINWYCTYYYRWRIQFRTEWYPTYSSWFRCVLLTICIPWPITYLKSRIEMESIIISIYERTLQWVPLFSHVTFVEFCTVALVAQIKNFIPRVNRTFYWNKIFISWFFSRNYQCDHI